MRSLWKALVSVALVALGLLGMALPAVAATTPPDNSYVTQAMFNDYCMRHYPGGSGVQLVENTAYGWKCVTASGQKVGISVASVCQENNSNTPNVVAWMPEDQYLNPQGAWQCTQLLHPTKAQGQAFGYQGRLDLAAYCKKSGWDTVALTGDTVATWKCESAGLTPQTISMSDACNTTYNPDNTGDVAVPIFNYWDPYSVTCWR